MTSGRLKPTQSGEEILWRFLVGESAYRAHHGDVGRKTQRAPRLLPRLRDADTKLSSGRIVHGHPDGPDPFGRDQPPADSLDGHPGPDAQRDVGETAQAALDRHVGAAATA